jgi:hypothetical protein
MKVTASKIKGLSGIKAPVAGQPVPPPIIVPDPILSMDARDFFDPNLVQVSGNFEFVSYPISEWGPFEANDPANIAWVNCIRHISNPHWRCFVTAGQGTPTHAVNNHTAKFDAPFSAMPLDANEPWTVMISYWAQRNMSGLIFGAYNTSNNSYSLSIPQIAGQAVQVGVNNQTFGAHTMLGYSWSSDVNYPLNRTIRTMVVVNRGGISTANLIADAEWYSDVLGRGTILGGNGWNGRIGPEFPQYRKFFVGTGDLALPDLLTLFYRPVISDLALQAGIHRIEYWDEALDEDQVLLQTENHMLSIGGPA